MNDFQWNIALPNEEGGSQGMKGAGGHLRSLHETRSLFSLSAFNLRLVTRPTPCDGYFKVEVTRLPLIRKPCVRILA